MLVAILTRIHLSLSDDIDLGRGEGFRMSQSADYVGLRLQLIASSRMILLRFADEWRGCLDKCTIHTG